MKFFCRGGMRAAEVDNQQWENLLANKPTHVVLLFRGRPLRDLDEDQVHLSVYGQKKYSLALYQALIQVL